LKIYLHLQDPFLKGTLSPLLTQAGFHVTADDTDCDGVLYTPPYTPKTIPALNFLDIPQPLRLPDFLALLTRLPYTQHLLFSHFSFDLREKILTDLLSQKTSRLTEKEAQLLHFFIQHKDHPVSKETLLKEIWAYHPEAETHTLETHIYRLRQKLEEDPTSPQVLINCREGYVLA